MVFKPFKPPLMSKPQSSAETKDEDDHSTKKPRLEKNELAPAPDTRLTPTLGTRKPLVQVRNNGKESTGKKKGGFASNRSAGNERYFNVLWYVHPNPSSFIPSSTDHLSDNWAWTPYQEKTNYQKEQNMGWRRYSYIPCRCRLSARCWRQGYGPSDVRAGA